MTVNTNDCRPEIVDPRPVHVQTRIIPRRRPTRCKTEFRGLPRRRRSGVYRSFPVQRPNKAASHESRCPGARNRPQQRRRRNGRLVFLEFNQDREYPRYRSINRKTPGTPRYFHRFGGLSILTGFFSSWSREKEKERNENALNRSDSSAVIFAIASIVPSSRPKPRSQNCD